MKQKVFFLGVLLGSLFSFSAAQNYLDVPPDPNFSHDYLNNVIYGDTTETGERITDRVYRLEIGGIYYFNNTIKTDGWSLKIVAEGEATPEFSKAIILAGINDQGKSPATFAEVHGDILFKNLYFSLISTKNKQVSYLTKVYKDHASLEMDNCFVEWAKAYAFARVYSSYTSVRIRDSYFRNTSSIGGPYNGKILKFEDNPVNEIFIQNCTFVNNQGPLVSVHYNTVNRFQFDHNTVVNTLIKPFQFEYWADGVVTNNIFFNTASYGQNPTDVTEEEPAGFINFYKVPDSLFVQVGLASQNERKLDVRNNLYYLEQDVEEYFAKWAEIDSTQKIRWMNDSTLTFVQDDINYPFINVDSPMDENVGFVEYPTADSMIAKMDQWRTDGQKTTWFWVDDDGNKVANETDRPHDLSYATSSTAYTAADGGFPLGDLNWFLDKKAEWEEWITGVEWEKTGNAPVDFMLSQNYPNPFNPETTIEYTLKSAGKATLTIYNTLGQAVRRLMDKKQAAGAYQVQWDGRSDNGEQLPSGIYYCKLQAGEQSLVGKMALMR